MQKCEHEILDRLVDEYLSVVKEKYSERYYHLQITESKSKSTYFVNFFFFWMHFFLFCEFLQQHQNAIKSNNKINANQLLRLPLSKHTHTHTHTHTQMIIIIVKTIIIIKKGNTNLPPQVKSIPTISQTEDPTVTFKELKPQTVVAKTSTLEAAGILDPLHSYSSAS